MFSTWLILLDLPDQAHFLSSLSFIEFQTVEFEHLSSSTFAGILSFGSINTIFSGFFKLVFSRVGVLRVKTSRVFEFRVAQ